MSMSSSAQGGVYVFGEGGRREGGGGGVHAKNAHLMYVASTASIRR